MDLVVYFSAMEGRFTYYINNSSAGFKIEFPIACIKAIKMDHMVRKVSLEGDGREEVKHRARIMIELLRPPQFYSDGHGVRGWQLCHDFTQGLVASRVLLHTLVGPYDALHAQITELATMSPELQSRLWVDEKPQYLTYEEEESISTPAPVMGEQNVNPSSVMAPPRPASTIPAQFARQHLSPSGSVPAFQYGTTPPGARVRPTFQAHKRTRSRSLPTAINVSELALAASHHHLGIVPGMKYSHQEVDSSYVPMSHHAMLYSQPQTPLRIDTSVADSTMDYYRQFTPSSNISSLTPVEYVTSPVSQVALPFYEGSGTEYHIPSTYAHTGVYSTDAMYADEVSPTPLLSMDQFPHQDTFTYTDPAAMQEGTPYAESNWSTTPQVTVTNSAQMDVVEPTEVVQQQELESQDPSDVKMED
jgi:hypothetical protein